MLEALHANNVPFINGGEPLTWIPEIPIWASLAVIVGALAVTTWASAWRRPAGDDRRAAAARLNDRRAAKQRAAPASEADPPDRRRASRPGGR